MILEFSTRKLESELKKLQAELSECNAHIENAFEAILQMENHIEILEMQYNDKLFELAKRIGAENITLDQLKFATNVAISAGSQLVLEDPNDPEITLTLEKSGDVFTFTPEEDL